ncbi:MAG TPA: helix-turn-helix transcriptional regulator [Candidatus Cybelea sp.]|jgi:DNA-binding PadR family transcriptional regulator|nr:helix-turn-helix transcriptional regulator [Candidatus Cybelea sp.]
MLTFIVHKELIVLGLLREGPAHGHELHRIVRAHGVLYADLKKANLYHLLARLAEAGLLKVSAETGTRGRLGERMVYSLTAAGSRRLNALLRDVVRTYETPHSGIEVATILMSRLGASAALALLRERREAVAARRAMLAQEFAGFEKRSVYSQLSAEHLTAATDAELAWIDRALARLSEERHDA